MKHLVTFWIFMAHLFSGNNLLLAQWERTLGPFSENITSFAVNGESILAGTKYGGIFISNNNGDNWTRLDNGLPNTSITCFAKINNNLFVGTEGGGVFVSTDGGQSVVPVNTGLTNSSVYSLAVSGNKLFANTAGGLFYSSNLGSNWTYISYFKDSLHVNVKGGPLCVRQINGGGTSIYVGDYTGLYRSNNDGITWSKLNNPSTPTGDSNPYITALAVVPNANGGTWLFAGSWRYGVFKTSDDGMHWETCNTGLKSKWSDDVYVTDFAVKGSTLFVSENLQSDFEGGVFLSSDYGATWTSTNLELKSRDVNALIFKDNYLFAGTTKGGIFRSINNGANWIQANTGLTFQYINAFALDGSNLYAGAGNGSVFLSPDKGGNWSQLNNNTEVGPITAITIADKSDILASTESGLYHSSDKGLHWGVIDYTIDAWRGIYSNTSIWSLIHVPNQLGGSYIFAGTLNYGIYRSKDHGAHWEVANTGLWANSGSYSDSRNYIVYTFAAGPNASGGMNVYAGMGHQGIADYGEVYRSSDYGVNWEKMSTGLPQKHVWCLAISGNYLFAGTNGSGMYRSSSNGNNWVAVNTGLTSKIISALAVSGNRIFAGTYNGGIFQSTTNGDSWSPMNENLDNLSINALVSDEAHLYAGTVGGGVWKRSLAEITAIKQTSAEKPMRFILLQNYPNPFNPRTTIKFSLPEAGPVTLTVFNNNGQKVAELASQDMSAGMHTLEWDATDFASGVYYCRLEMRNHMATNKLLLLR